MPALLTAASTMQCPHGGMVTAVPGSTKASASDPILRASDSCTIAGCTFQISGAPNPCLTVEWQVAANKVKHGGEYVLNESSVGLCMSAASVPQGTVLIASTQESVSGL